MLITERSHAKQVEDNSNSGQSGRTDTNAVGKSLAIMSLIRTGNSVPVNQIIAYKLYVIKGNHHDTKKDIFMIREVLEECRRLGMLRHINDQNMKGISVIPELSDCLRK